MYSSTLICPYCRAENNAQATNCFVCWQALHVSVEPVSISVTPLLRQRYRVVSLTGKGGMGAVYKAEDTKLGDRLVAVKEMSLRGLNPREENEAIRNFKREALMLANLQHPHLPRIYDHFSENGQWYLIMDFIAGETLEEYLRRKPEHKLPFEEVLSYGIQLCTVLDYLHTRQPPIIFRDLKPANIMRGSEGQLYLIDFGIARLFKPGQANDTVAFGSPGYAAPEQYGQTQTTPRSDIYNLGAILHHLLTGKDPAQTPFFFAPLTADLEAIGLQTLLSSMLSLQMQQRPQSATMVKQALQQIATQTPHNRSLMLKIQTSQPKSKQVAFLPVMGALISTYTEHDDWISEVAWSPDGQRVSSASYDGSVQVWNAFTVRTITTYRQHRHKIFGHLHMNTLAWSPDGQRIAAGSNNKTVDIWNATNGQILLTYRNHPDDVRSITWAADGQKLASASKNKIHIWDAKNAKTLTTHTLFRDEIDNIEWSPNSKYLATANLLQIVHIFEISAQMELLLRTSYRNHKGAILAVAWAPDGIRVASASDDKTVQIWNGMTGNHLLSYTAHNTIIKAITWSPDGSYIASAGYDGTIQIWNTLTGNHLFTFQKHSSPIYTIAWSPDGRYIASGGEDKAVHIWQAV